MKTTAVSVVFVVAAEVIVAVPVVAAVLVLLEGVGGRVMIQWVCLWVDSVRLKGWERLDCPKE